MSRNFVTFTEKILYAQDCTSVLLDCTTGLQALNSNGRPAECSYSLRKHRDVVSGCLSFRSIYPYTISSVHVLRIH